jgi:hypothetical protein
MGALRVEASQVFYGPNPEITSKSNASVTGGSRTGVVLCEPLNGGSLEGKVTEARISKNAVKGVRLRS